MENNMIGPDSLGNLALDVLKNYDISPSTVTVIQSGGIKTIWKIRTDSETVCLKRLKQTYDKALFSVNAQIYIKNKGGNVPGIMLNINNQPITIYNDQLFVVYEWLNGRDLNFGTSKDLEPAVKGLAKFHMFSKGYNPVENSRTSSKLGKSPEQYASMKNKFAEWKAVAANNASAPQHSTYLKYVDSMIAIAGRAIELINKSSYDSLTGPGSDSVVLCHQDYGKGNALMTGNGIYVLDLDGVTYDLPARDLRKVIGKQAEDRNRWSIELINEVTDWYTQINPMDENEKHVLYIDLLFPHWFFGLVKNIYQSDKAVKPAKIEKICKLEQGKIPILDSLLQWNK
ncbi:MAG TPA: CotS family spore coat protein [Bacillota bacterium]|nr:CotS family spore coat protein [Bacillota bacterium]HRS22017.1 CotS family spore coat protein [Clostridia bacterium]HRU42284.1 CotS family spore coat protein [Candidatus Diapherotrites archaeon]HQE66784.1 CotS family spore coat protein [Bacillota bacterium]HQI16792.1 CotS family spore coat protein [Bacillota bacterium]